MLEQTQKLRNARCSVLLERVQTGHEINQAHMNKNSEHSARFKVVAISCMLKLSKPRIQTLENEQ